MTNWTAFLVAAAATVVLLAMLLRRSHALPVDHPNERSLHEAPTPRIGGLALFPGCVAGFLAAGGAAAGTSSLLLGLAAGLFAVSIIDDWRGLGVVPRFGAHLLAAAVLVVAAIGLSPLAIVAVLAIGWMTNLFNFMDGANGLAGGMAAMGFAAFGLAHGSPVLAFALVGAALGFLAFNFDPARVFLGDAGSIPLGFLAGGLGFSGVVAGDWPWWFPVLVFSPFIIDASVTLVRRAARGDRFWTAHREHYYQRLVRMGWSHRRLALVEYALMAACGASALGLLHVPPTQRVIGLAAWLAIYLAVMVRIDLAWARCAQAPGGGA